MNGRAYELACIRVLKEMGCKPLSLSSRQRARLMSKFEPKLNKVAEKEGFLPGDLSDSDLLDYCGCDLLFIYGGWQIGIDFTLRSDVETLGKKVYCGNLIKGCLALDHFIVFNGDPESLLETVKTRIRSQA